MREPMKIEYSYYFHFVEKAAALLLLACPALMLTVKGGMNAVFIFMLLLALAVWMVRPAGVSAVAWKPEWTAYVVAMILPSFAILVSQVAHQNITAHPMMRLRVIGWQFRFPVVAVPSFAGDRHAAIRFPARCHWGIDHGQGGGRQSDYLYAGQDSFW